METFFGDDPDEIRHLVNILHQALSDSIQALTDTTAANIKNTSHRIASELMICGADSISAQAKSIEHDAEAGFVNTTEIKRLISDLELITSELADWIASDQS